MELPTATWLAHLWETRPSCSPHTLVGQCRTPSQELGFWFLAPFIQLCSRKSAESVDVCCEAKGPTVQALDSSRTRLFHLGKGAWQGVISQFLGYAPAS